MVKLVAMIKRKAGMAPEEFHSYWRDHHGPLVASTKSGAHAVRYEQHHRPLSDYRGAGDTGYDGVTIQWFTTSEDFHASLSEPDYPLIEADIAKFIDTSDLAWVLTEEPHVVVDGDVRPGSAN
ncbi:MAG: EthD domain-containing protein [Acidimicrobiales bacterium]